ncbi:hypothetical protein OHB12_12135 [Nocardia sp. NBC_01730]|uniref:hypothetical protein n=1 Tax=Nocardia sp. NBC_01730 TaxID=2975998 RepID=UPI002E0F3150|nr:hypothetical protein OHB12_12135 [Nocardia sp. NBC_01730]
MTTRTFLTALVSVGAAVVGGCATNTPPPAASDQPDCQAPSFAPPFTKVDPCSAAAVLTAAVTTMFSYRPIEHADQRAAFRAASLLMASRFADRAEPAALVWAPVCAEQWQQWRSDATTITTSARVTSDDHPTTASRVMAVEIEPSNQPPIRWAVYAHATRTTAASAWLLSGMEVLA